VKRLLISLISATALMCLAQERGGEPAPSRLAGYMEPGTEASGVRAPYYDEQGNLQAQLYGEHAKVMGGGMAEITNLRIDVYRDGQVAMTIFAPKCFSHMDESRETPGKKVLSLSSEGAVLIELGEVSIAGRGFRFTSEDNRFEILHDSKVLIKAPARSRNGEGL